MSRLEAVWRLLSHAEAVDGEIGSVDYEHGCSADAVQALRVLGVSDVEIAAARRKAQRPRAWPS